MPSAGHVIDGETSIQGAIRETYEELGIKTTESDYKFICENIADKSSEIAQVYLLKLDIDISDLVLQEEEISEVKWLTYEDFKKLFYSKEFVLFDNEYRELGGTLDPTPFNLLEYEARRKVDERTQQRYG